MTGSLLGLPLIWKRTGALAVEKISIMECCNQSMKYEEILEETGYSELRYNSGTGYVETKVIGYKYTCLICLETKEI